MISYYVKNSNMYFLKLCDIITVMQFATIGLPPPSKLQYMHYNLYI